MTKLKHTYLSPETDLLVVRFEESILSTTGNMNASGWTSGSSNWFDDED